MRIINLQIFYSRFKLVLGVNLAIWSWSALWPSSISSGKTTFSSIFALKHSSLDRFAVNSKDTEMYQSRPDCIAAHLSS